MILSLAVIPPMLVAVARVVGCLTDKARSVHTWKRDPHPPGFHSFTSKIDKLNKEMMTLSYGCWILLRQSMTVGGVTNNVLIGSHGF